jgi:hypothetical protein
MEKNELFKCSYYECGQSFLRNNFPLYTKSPPINDEDKLNLIIDGILITKLFCIKCSINYAISICNNSKISIQNNTHSPHHI